MSRPYQKDLAYIHDVGYSHFVNGAAPGLLELLRRARIHEGLVVDLGCGPGSWAAQLIHNGYEALGIDISSAMIAIARQRAPAAQFRRRSFLAAKLPTCSAVTALGEVVCYLFDQKVEKQGLSGLFRRVHEALLPNGLFIFDLLDTEHRSRIHNGEGKDWATLVRIDVDRSSNLLTRDITYFRKAGTTYRRGKEIHRQRLFDRADIANQLRDIGFRVRIVRGYGDYRFRRGHVGFVARKI